MICVVFKQCTDVPRETPAKHTIDTVFIEKYIRVLIKPNNEPVKVEIYKQKDTILRKEVEKQPIIEAVDIKKNEVDITTIDTSGLLKTEIHKIEPDSKEVKIDNIGLVEEKKRSKAHKVLVKVWKGTKTGLAIIGGSVVIIFIADHI